MFFKPWFSEGAKQTKEKVTGAPRSPHSPARSHPGQTATQNIRQQHITPDSNMNIYNTKQQHKHNTIQQNECL